MTLEQAARKALEALEIGYDSARAEAAHFHASMNGYKPYKHAQIDADVEKIAQAITALRAALAEAQSAEPVDERKAFEAWLAIFDWAADTSQDESLDYLDPEVDNLWRAWQARAALEKKA